MNEKFNMIALLNFGGGYTNKFEEIYRTYSRYLFAIGLKVLKDADLASDALQQCYFKIYQNIDRMKDIELKQTRPFLGSIMRNESLMIYKKYSAIDHVTESLKDESFIIDQWEKETADIKVPGNAEFIILSMADEFHKIQIREKREKNFKSFLRVAAVAVLALVTALTILTVSVEAVRSKIFEFL